MKRIMIIGGPGSGKSTAARMIGEALGLPVYYMDREVHWLPGWVERDKAEKAPIVERIIANDVWVFEGGNSATYDKRLARAEMLIWLDVPLWLRLIRVVRRSVLGRGKTRPDLADECPERLRMLPEFIGFILRHSRPAHAKQAALFARADIPKHRFRRARDVNAFVAGL